MDTFLTTLPQLLVQLPGLVIVKDLSSRILCMNEPLGRLLGLRDASAAVGCFEFDLSPCVAHAGEAFLQQDAATLRLKRQRFVDVITYDDGITRAILSEKVCLHDPSGAPCALLFQGTDVSGPLFGRVGALLANHVDRALGKSALPVSYSLDTESACPALPPRLAECLFFLLRGQTARGIATKLHLSPRTVEDYLEQLKSLFGCASKQALIAHAIDAGLGNYMPASLLKISCP